MKKDSSITRRDIIKATALLGVTATFGGCSLSKEDIKRDAPFIKKGKKKRVVICGGGFGGLSVAKSLATSDVDVEIIVIEKRVEFFSCPYSNAWLGEVEGATYQKLVYDYFTPSLKYGYEVKNAEVLGIDKKNRRVESTIGDIEYDYLVLSPGIDYNYNTLFSDKEKQEECYKRFPPAFKANGEHIFLKKSLENFKGGTFVMNVPSGTYRCPPAPYERACMIASYLKNNNIDGKILLLDSRTSPAAKPHGFLRSFKELYSDYIDYVPSSKIYDIDLNKNSVKYEMFDKKALDFVKKEIDFGAANINPSHVASKLIEIADIKIDGNGWALLKEPGYISASDDRIYVLGDAQGEYPFPKSGQMASSCGYIVGKSISSRIQDIKFDYAKNLPGNVCYSLVNTNPKEGIVVHHSVTYNTKDGMKVEAIDTKKGDQITGEATTLWFEGIMGDLLG